MGSELRFDGKVVIVTGAGGGLGRSHALLLASRGARVVVNDLGGSMHGGGSDQKAADVVVAEIKEAGGDAVANYDSVEDGDKIVQTAMDTYGRIDVVVNNAGILRDKSFHKMTVEDWEIIQRVHVNGSFRVTHAAWPHMREQGFGRVVMTASAAGIYGNFGQANYSAAKLGLVGFGNTLAIEGGRKGIHVNTIAPIAGSRLTETVLPPDLIDALRPEYVSPLVAWLCHEECEENGGLFEVGGGYFAKLRWERTKGNTVRLGRQITPETVQKAWSAITDFKEAEHPSDITGSMGPVMENVQAGPSKGGNDLVDVDLALGYEYPEMTSRHDPRDLSLYALGIGAGKDPLNEQELRLVYEMHGKGFVAFPTYAVIPAMKGLIDLATGGNQVPGLNYGLDRLLHGEQYTEVLRPLPPKAKLTHRARIKEIWDKGKGAVINTEAKTYDESGDLLAINEYVYFIRGAGGFGGDRGPSVKVNEAPDRKPDAVVEEKVAEDQALLYRLSGDVNPLHIDPSFAGAFGFDRPILHGLCTFGHAARHVVGEYAPDGDPRYFKSIRVRFSKSVFPGDTLVTEMWKESDRKIVFRTKVKERDEVVISNAAVELYDAIPKPRAKKAEPKKAAAAPAEPISADIFNAIGTFFGTNAETVQKVQKVFQFQLTHPDSLWTVDAKAGAVGEGETAKPDCTLALSDSDFMDMCTGKADPMKLFSSGKLKISGDVMASQKLSFLKKLEPQMVMDAMKARAGDGGADTAAERSGPLSGDVFLGIKAYVAHHPELVERVQKVFQFQLSDPESVWTVDVKNGKGQVAPGETTKPDCTLAISEADFIDLTSGKADAMKLFSTGKLKISGDVMASQKLSFLQKIEPEWAKEQIAKLKAEGTGPSASAAATPVKKKNVHTPIVIDALKKALADNPGLAGEVNAVVELRVADPDSGWTVNLKDGAEVTEGLASSPDCTLTLTDETLHPLCTGAESLQALFQAGKLRVDGDVAVAHRLGFLGKLVVG